jgi:TPR repeat protein
LKQRWRAQKGLARGVGQFGELRLQKKARMATRLALQLIKGAKNNDALAQLALGKLYLSGGEGLAANNEAALQWLLRAARAGIADAELLIAERVALDCAGPQVHRYMEACQHAAALGHAAGYCALGNIYSSRVDAAVDLGKAQAAYRVAAHAGYVPAARKLGLLLAKDAQLETARDSEEARHWLQSAAATGDRLAAQGLAELLWRNGDDEAAQWLELEAQAGDPEAMYRLGEILCRQLDAEQARRGAYWLDRAVRKGHARALWRYGRLHVNSFSSAPTGLTHSLLKASRLLERAAAAGVSEALWDLARIYKMPQFSRRDVGKARGYLEQAASAGICEAELKLGKRLTRYKNNRPALIEAGRWLNSAGKKGSSEAKVILERISQRASAWSLATIRRQEEILDSIRNDHPIVAARLELAARFGLSTREMVFINPLDADRAWCLEVDLSKYFKRKLWRLVLIESTDQRLALRRACEAFLAAGSSQLDLMGLTTRDKARHLAAALLRLSVDPSLFVHNWRA